MSKNNYEELLPKDPIGALNKIKENYTRYFNTFYHFSDNELEEKKRKAFASPQDKVAYREPYIEMLPEYQSCGKSLDQYINEDQELRAAFQNFPEYAEFIKKGLMDYTPYQHQVDMLKKAYLGVNGKHNTIITSGTGSGKTESFMLPLLASLLNEVKQRNDEGQTQNYDTGWMNKDRYDAPYQRQSETDGHAAIRALIMYPMNALVEDQLTRLREALDSDEVRSYLDGNFGRNRIFFGQYNGSTIGGSKTIDDYHILGDAKANKAYSSIAKQVGSVKAEYQALVDHIAEKSNAQDAARRNFGEDSAEYRKAKKEYKKANDAKYIAPRLTDNVPCSEMITRWDMQAFPPDILITNYSMLSIMMMRHTESEMIRKTKEWYENHPDAVFYLVIDELHLYRNTSGTEIAFLIRMFLNAIGVPPTIVDNTGRHVPNPQLRILASSASLGCPRETEDFARQFFGTYYDSDQEFVFNIVEGTDYELIDIDGNVNYNDFGFFNSTYVNADEIYKTNIKQGLLRKYGCETIEKFIDKYADRIFSDFRDAMTRDGKVCPIDIDELCQKLECESADALRGFFIFRADEEVNKYCSDPYPKKLPRFRFHQYFRYVDGLWGELITPQPRNGKNDNVIGDVMFHARPIHNKHHVLELMRCECCGELFFGGNVPQGIDRSRNDITLSLNCPELDKIPNRNPTPMVQNKTYKEYAVFWPTMQDKDVEPDGGIVVNNYPYRDARTRLGNVGWMRAWLNPIDGTCTVINGGHNGWIKGYLYVSDRGGDIPALPVVCPHCDKDYSKREYTFSPIRSFRTGIKRNNQILSKELIYQLPADGRKLIGFSDSRQDAAEQAQGIALEHYRDMVRLLFMQEVDKGIQNDTQALTVLKDQLSPQPYQDVSYRPQIQFSQGLTDRERNGLIGILDNPLIQNKADAIQNFHLQTLDIPLASFVQDLNPVNNQQPAGQLVDGLKDLGINPAGSAHKMQEFDGHHWAENFFGTQPIGAYNEECLRIRNKRVTYTNRVSNLLKAAICKNSFGQFMGVSTEEVGLGYITYLFDQNVLQTLIPLCYGCDPQNVMSAIIRILGDSYRYEDPDGTEDDMEKTLNDIMPLKKVLAKFLSGNGIPDNEIYGPRGGLTNPGTMLVNFLNTVSGVLNGTQRILPNGNAVSLFSYHDGNRKRLGIQLPLSDMVFHKVNDGDHYYVCNTCGRVHLHQGLGVCTNPQCKNGRLVEAIDENGNPLTVEHLRSENYIAYDIEREPREACRLHTEELTGQTDEQGKRLLQFKGVIVDNSGLAAQNKQNIARAKEVDMLNVTTTMEVGVDIGSLLAVYQGNMPPTRYNYQQRVGRGGRRGQAFSAAVTFCRGKSHDSYYYDEGIKEMTGGQPATPKLAVSQCATNDTIVKRVIAKDVLQKAFKDKVPYDATRYTENTINDTCGEFDTVGAWQSHKTDVSGWIRDNGGTISDIVKYYMDQYASGNVDKIANWVQNNLVDLIDDVVTNAYSQEMGLAQCLAEQGILPMYGMPSSVRDFYHGYKEGNHYEKGDFLSIDRPLEQSITEFAPGAIKTKDHGEYMSNGLTVSAMTKKVNDPANFTADEKKRWDALEHTYCMIKDGSTIADIVPPDQNIQYDDQTNIRLVVPKAYRSRKLKTNKGDVHENDDRGNYSQAILWAKESGTPTSHDFCNALVSYWQCGQGSQSGVWYVNDNNERLFEGQYQYRHASDEIDPVTWNPRNMQQNNLDDAVLNQIVQNAPNFMIDDSRINDARIGNTMRIALGANKCTDLLKLSVARINDQLCLDTRVGNRPAIIAAYYSAASLIQRVFADEMDIVPEELEITEIKIDRDGIPAIYLNDALVNGSGYVNMLVSWYVDSAGNQWGTMIEYIMNKIVNFEGTYMQSIKNHQKDCPTACVKCLQTFYNSGYHHVLDWRLGVDLIKLMLDSEYKMGWGNYDTPYGDMRSIIDNAGNVAAMADPLNVRYDENRKTLTYNGNVKIDVVHPLWANADGSQDFFTILRKGFQTPNAITPPPFQPNNDLILGV